MVDVQLTNGEEGNFDDLRLNTIDPSDTINDIRDVRNGKKRFLSWRMTKDEEGKQMWEAFGKDGKVYRIKDDDPKPIKKGKVEIV